MVRKASSKPTDSSTATIGFEAKLWLAAKLGTYSFAEIALETSSLIVVNAYTQFDWRGRGPKVDYGAVRFCMGWIKKHYPERRIGLPKIGAGLAGGDWPTTSTIIEEELAGEDLTLVEYRA